MTFDHGRESRRLERKLAQLRKKDYLPEQLVDLVGRTAALQLEARGNVHVEAPSRDSLPDTERNLQGVPLLASNEFTCDPADARALFDKLVEVCLESGEPISSAAATVRDAVASGELDLNEAFRAYIRGEEEPFAAWEKKTPAAPRMLHFLTKASLAPGLSALAAELEKHLEDNRHWTHGHCPVCGSLPLIADLRQKEGHRYLTCSFCNTSYKTLRLLCAFCGETDHEKLEFFEASGEPGFQAHLCKSCNRYIKTTDFRDFDRISIPVLDDLESLVLDVLAREQGYERPTLSAWGF